MTEQVCRNCGEPIVEGPSGFWSHKAGHACCGPNQFADPTASHYESASAAKEDVDAFNAAERPEQVADAHDCAKCGRSVYVADGCEFNGNDGDVCWPCLADNYEALKQSHEKLVKALTDMKCGWRYIREVYGDLYGVGWDRAEILAKEALANAKKLTEGL